MVDGSWEASSKALKKIVVTLAASEYRELEQLGRSPGTARSLTPPELVRLVAVRLARTRER